MNPGIAYQKPFNTRLTRPFWVALVIAIAVHIVIVSIQFQTPESTQSSPSLEITLEAPLADKTMDVTPPTPTLEAIEDATPAAARPDIPNPLVAEPKPNPQPSAVTVPSTEAQPEELQAERPAVQEAPRPDETIKDKESPPPPTLNLRGRITQQALREQEIISDMMAANERMTSLERIGRLTSRTVHGPEGAYLAAWKQKVERIGNMNYPSEAARKNLSGTLVLEVTIQPDGQVSRMVVRRSSGYPELDEGAKRIVEMAAPYSPFPPELAERYDQLVITRTWAFSAGNRLRTD